MVSTKVIVLALVLVACLIQVQGRYVRGASASGGSGSDNIMNNFGQFFTNFNKNPSDMIIVITNFFKKGDSVSAS